MTESTEVKFVVVNKETGDFFSANSYGFDWVPELRDADLYRARNVLEDDLAANYDLNLESVTIEKVLITYQIQ